MKKIFTFSLLFALSLIMAMPQANSQEITTGTDYWLAVPYCKKHADESFRGEYPIGIWITSKVATTANIKAELFGVEQTVTLEPNVTTIVELPEPIMNTESEVIRNKGIHVTAEDPVIVVLYMSYDWSGEAYRAIPVEWLGTEYYTLNLYLDKTAISSSIPDYKPPQILIVATEDNTQVTYTLKAPSQKVEAGVPMGVMLNKGETFLILGRESEAGVQNWDYSDFTGSHITSDKPIAVISGHTKGTFPMLYTEYRSGWMEPTADFSKNMLIESMWPVEVLGKKYVSAPLYYANGRPNMEEDPDFLIQDQGGDLIRFVATVDNTIIKKSDPNGTGDMRQMSPKLDRGDWYHITSAFDAAAYEANHPILVGQYGKSWWGDNGMMGKVETKKGKDEEIQNPHENSQGMLLVLAPEERWTTYASFLTPDDLTNHIYLTFKTEDAQDIYFNDRRLSAVGSVLEIPGTEYSYFTHGEIQKGTDHVVEAKDSAKFAGYVYGDWKRMKSGFAYGYPIGINYAPPCEDTLIVTEEMDCGDITGHISNTPNVSCSGIFVLRVKDMENYSFDYSEFDRGETRELDFNFDIINPKDTASVTLFTMSKSGKTVQKDYEYYPELIEATKFTNNLGLLSVGDTEEQTITLRNVGHDELIINNIRFKDNKPEFEFDFTGITFPYPLPAGETVSFKVIGTAITKNHLAIDRIIAELSCYEETVAEVLFNTGEPVIWITDAEILNVPVNEEDYDDFTIESRGDVPAVISSITWNDKTHFTRIETPVGTEVEWPIILENNGDSYDIRVWYTPNGEPDVDHTDRATFETNANPDNQNNKLYSDWLGNGIDAAPAIEGYDWQLRRVIDDYSINTLGVLRYDGTVKIWNTGTSDLTITSLKILADDGIFVIDDADMPSVLTAANNVDNPVVLPASFIPLNEQEYVKEVELKTEFAGEEMVVTAMLEGIGQQPHIAIDGYDFGTIDIDDQVSNGQGRVYAEINNEYDYPMELTITDLYIAGANPEMFEIEQSWLDQQDFSNFTIQPGDNIFVPIIYRPTAVGDHTAQLKATHNAPEDPAGQLTGSAYSIDIDTEDYIFGEHFITTTAPNGTVYLHNKSSIPINILDEPILASDIYQEANFEVVRYYLDDGTTVTDWSTPLELGPDEKLNAEVNFTPDEAIEYEAYITYDVDVYGKFTSDLFGSGKRVVVYIDIPTDYVLDPGRKASESQWGAIEVRLNDVKLHSAVNGEIGMDLSEADIKEFTVEIQFKPDGQLAHIQDVYPYPENFDATNVITNGTLTQGFTVNSATIKEDKYLEVHLTGNTPIAGTGTLFRFDMQAFLSDNDQIPLPLEGTIHGPQANYVQVEETPGLITVDPVCVNDMRHVIISAENYSLQDVNPNPAKDNATIKYSVGLEAHTNLSIFNSNGEEVANLVDNVQQPGVYEFNIDFDNLGLPAGVYYYKIQSGPFSETKSLVIIK